MNSYRKPKAFVIKKLKLKIPRTIRSHQILAYSGPAVTELLSERYSYDTKTIGSPMNGKGSPSNATSPALSHRAKNAKSNNFVFKYTDSIV